MTRNLPEITPAPPSELWTDLMSIVWRRRIVVLATFVATVLGAYVSLQLMTEKFESVASLLVKLGRENAEAPPTVQNTGFISTGIRREEVNSEIQMLTSRVLVGRVVDEIGTEPFLVQPPPPKSLLRKVKYYAKRVYSWCKAQFDEFLILVDLKKRLDVREKIILTIERGLTVTPQKESDVIRARFRFPDPVLGQRVLERLLEVYINERISVRQHVGVKAFFDRQFAEIDDKLTSIEKARSELRRKWKMGSVDGHRQVLLTELANLNGKLVAGEEEKARLVRQREAMVAKLDGLPDELRSARITNANPSVSAIKERIVQLHVDRVEKISRYSESSTVVAIIGEQIAELEDEIRSLEPTVVGSETSVIHPLKQSFRQEIERTDVRIAGLDASIRRIEIELAENHAAIESLDTAEEELDVVERERTLAEQIFFTYAKRREEARISEELDRGRVSNIAVMSQPTLPIVPVYPRKLLIMAVSLPAGLVLGIGLSLGVHYVSDHVEGPRDLLTVEGVDYLGTVRLDMNLNRVAGGSSAEEQLLPPGRDSEQ